MNPPGGTFYEHHVGSWALTKLGQVFPASSWIITPEKTDEYSKKKPDLVVERLFDNNKQAVPHLLMELKKNGPSVRCEEALSQLVLEIAETFETVMNVFVVVQCGTKIGFFDYHNDVSNLDEENIPHFRGCLSLTERFGEGNQPFSALPIDLEPLRYDVPACMTDQNRIDIRGDAEDYQVPCIFDIHRHGAFVDYFFNFISLNAPRSFWYEKVGQKTLDDFWFADLYLGLYVNSVCSA